MEPTTAAGSVCCDGPTPALERSSRQLRRWPSRQRSTTGRWQPALRRGWSSPLSCPRRHSPGWAPYAIRRRPLSRRPRATLRRAIRSVDPDQPVRSWSASGRSFSGTPALCGQGGVLPGRPAGRVLYNPDDPSDPRLDAWVNRWGHDAILVALGLFLIGMGMLGWHQSRPQAQQRPSSAGSPHTCSARGEALAATRAISGPPFVWHRSSGGQSGSARNPQTGSARHAQASLASHRIWGASADLQPWAPRAPTAASRGARRACAARLG
jgi:hypothetical protein